MGYNPYNYKKGDSYANDFSFLRDNNYHEPAE